jgi:hypothetical protein
MSLNGYIDDDVARLVGGVGRTAVTRWRNDSRNPSMRMLRRLAEVSSGSVAANDFAGAGLAVPFRARLRLRDGRAAAGPPARAT